jgi:cytochrome c oxidase subunit 1
VSGWRRIIGFNLLWAIVLGIAGFFLGAWIGREIADSKDYLVGTDQNDVAVFMGFLLATIGWLAGLGFFNYPLSRLAGRPQRYPVEQASGAGRYFRLSTDHKVIGIQYFFGVGAFFLIGGINAMNS